MNFRFLILIISDIALLFLVLLVFLKGRKRLVNQLFILFILCVAIWILGIYKVHTQISQESNLFWGRGSFASATLVPLSFLFFLKVFPNKSSLSLKKDLIFFSSLGILFVFLSFSPFIIAKSVLVQNKQLKPVYGHAYLFWGVYFIFCFGYTFFILAKRWKLSQGIKKIQFQYLFLGVLISASGASITNLIIPSIFHTSRFSLYGPYFSLIMLGTIAHSIIRFRLMNIKIVVKKGFVYLISSIIAVSILFLLFFPARQALIPDIHIPTKVTIIITALSSIIVFYPLKKLFQILLDKYFYRGPYDYQHILRIISQALSVLEFRELLNYLSKMLVEQMKLESMAIFLKEEKSFQCKSIKYFFDSEIDKNPDLTNKQISEKNSFVIQELKYRMENETEKEKFLVREELARKIEEPKAQNISEELNSLGFDVAFPLTFEKSLIGVLFVGAKLSSDPYFQPDLELFSTVSNQSAIAIRNAQLFTEVKWMKDYNESILSEMESGVIAVDKSGKITTFNDTAENLLGINRKDVIEKNTSVLNSGISKLISDTLNSNKPVCQAETIITANNKRELPIIFSTSCLKNENGEITDCIIVFTDISKVKETEEKRQKIQRLAIIGSLASGLLHEVKNSLIPLRTFAELLPENYTDPEFRDNYSKIVLDEIDHVNMLFNQLRDLAHFSHINFTSVKISFAIDNALSLLKAQIEKSNVKVIKKYTEGLPDILADKTKLRQLFLNLFLNSLQFMKDGGEITIKTYVGDSVNHKSIFVEISDIGIGIKENELEQIFNPFFTTREDGTGLGLTICQNIVDAHKGNIWIRNNQEKGVTVTVSLPISQD